MVTESIDGGVVGVVHRSSAGGGETIHDSDYTAPAGAPTAAYTQTYSTASRTVGNATSSAVATTAATNVAPYGYAGAAQADAIIAAINAIRTDLDALKQVVTSLIDDAQALGFAS